MENNNEFGQVIAEIICLGFCVLAFVAGINLLF